jgi:HJR/Mrr/RecB family endonuclease
MPFPKQGDVEIPLLKVLADAGGSAKPRDVYPRVATHFPNLTVEEQELRLESSPGTLKNLTPTAFEHVCLELLQQLGFRNTAVTRRSADGGIDGYGDFRQGAVSIKSAFQAKRWNDAPVRRPEIDKLRGAIFLRLRNAGEIADFVTNWCRGRESNPHVP